MDVIINTAEWDAVLAEALRRLTDLTEPMQDIGELMVESTKQNFRDGTDPQGNAWTPKSQTTIDAYVARGDPASTQPLIGPTKVLSTTIYAQTDATSATWGSGAIQAAVMQFGAQKGEFGQASNETPIPWGDIPARPYIGLGEDDERNIIDVFLEHLDAIDDG